tara:strand:+ start:2311 stop:2469 length:159 start_codon:yes stop_codon:yes gene_type:complete
MLYLKALVSKVQLQKWVSKVAHDIDEATFYIAPYQDSFASSSVGAAEADAQS